MELDDGCGADSMNADDDLSALAKRLRTIAQLRRSSRVDPASEGLDRRVSALIDVGAALAMSSPPSTFRSLVDQAMAAGGTPEEVLGALLAVAPTIGAARTVANTPALALALGYDIDAALEDTENAAGC
jgi:alkylhydroperoxidase/carboxymuconolactone decarboxylase family protein YurZ